MLQKTKGIVLSHLKYKESSIIVRIFTREYGIQSYVVNSVRTRGKTNKMIYFQPLSILDLVVYYQEKKDLHRISETAFHIRYRTIPFDVRKSSITLFLAECIGKMLIEREENSPLFDFLEEALRQFDGLTSEYSEFHLYILMHLMDYLGHSVPNEEEDPILSALHEIGNTRQLPEGNRIKRNQLLHYLIRFYQEHSQLPLTLKSLDVLESVFD